MEQRILDILSDVEDVANQLKHAFVAKAELAELLVTCAIAQEHLLILGPPGTGKSELIKRFALLCSAGASGDERVPYFEYLLTRFTEPNEIFGAVDIAGLTQGRRVWRDTAGMLPRAEIAFLDEVFKANSAILNALLSILNERTFYNGARPEPVPLLCAVGAANEVPDDLELAALFDRFLLRAWSGNVEETLFPDLFARGWKLECQRIAEKGHGLRMANLTTTDALRAAHRELGRVDVDTVAREYREVVRRIRAEGIQLSDRRVVKLLKLIAASALRHRRTTATPADFWVLRYVWNDPEQIPHLQTIIDPFVQDAPDEAHAAERSLARIADDLNELRARRGSLRTDPDFADFLQQAEALRSELDRHTAGAQRDQFLNEINVLVEELLRRLDEETSGGTRV